MSNQVHLTAEQRDVVASVEMADGATMTLTQIFAVPGRGAEGVKVVVARDSEVLAGCHVAPDGTQS